MNGGMIMEGRGLLTGRQQQILDYIRDHLKRNGYPPSVREIGLATGLSSSSTVHLHLTQLEEKGWIRRDPTKPRAIEVLDKAEEEAIETITLPILGKVAAGEPLTAVENIEGYFSVPAEFIGRGRHFILKVKGDSMIDAGILDGDMVIVRSQPVANNGEIVVALLDGEATVKRFYRNDEYVELRPENTALQPIISRNVSLAGVVEGLIRKF
jgi:repressor LexA